MPTVTIVSDQTLAALLDTADAVQTLADAPLLPLMQCLTWRTGAVVVSVQDTASGMCALIALGSL